MWNRSGITGIAALILAGASAHAQQAQPAGGVSAVTGSALAIRETAQDDLALNDPVFMDDILETGPDGKLRVTFADATQLTLGPAAEVVIDEYVYSPDKKTGTAALRIASGTARVLAGALEGANGQNGLQITTPVATIGIRGTDFFVELEGDHLQVALFSGYEVTVTNASGTTVLKPGEGTDVYGTAAPTPGAPWGFERINRALAMVTPIPDSARTLTYARPRARENTLVDALTRGDVNIEARLRYEHVTQGATPLPAHATTARLRVGYETAGFRGYFAGIEGEFTREVGGRRSDGVSFLPGRPVIPDPDSEQLNTLFAGWAMAGPDGMTAARAVVGRQRLSYDNERWIGVGAFRQNDQTFDAIALEGRPAGHLAVRYAYLDGINRVLGNNPGGHWRSDSHALGVTTDALP